MFKSQELSSLYEKLNEAKKRLENSKLQLKTSDIYSKNQPSPPAKKIKNILDSNSRSKEKEKEEKYESPILKGKFNDKSLEKVLKSSMYEEGNKSHVFY